MVKGNYSSDELASSCREISAKVREVVEETRRRGLIQ
jgi:hypothetical protein